MLEEERKIVWLILPQLSLTPLLCEVNPTEALSERQMLKLQPISTSIMGNRHYTKLVQIFKPTLEFNLHSIARELEMGFWNTE